LAADSAGIGRVTSGRIRRAARVKIEKIAGRIAATAIAFGVAAATVAPASAANNVKPLGVQETLNDWATGGPLIGYTVTSLNPSSDAIPYPVAGRLYEATMTVDGFGVPATPVIPMFNARAESGQNYRVLANAPGAPGPVPPGGSSTGKLYFDVVGDIPNSVVYNDGVQDLLVWIATSNPAGPGGAPTGGGTSSSLNGGAEAGGGNAPGGGMGPTGRSGAGGGANGITGSDAGGGDLGGANPPGGGGGAGGGGAGGTGGGAG
jgi:hypothetical protein